MTGKEIKEEVDNYLIKTREERKNAGLVKVPEFDERDVKQAYRDGIQRGLWHHSYDYLVKTADLKKRYEKCITELEAQIEKMKCCHNCKNCAYAGFEIICRTYDCINQSKWEIKEK